MEQWEIQEVLKRASEIDNGHTLETDAEIEALVSAAEESGISRDAVLQALHERLQGPLKAFTPGDLVFARSHDGRHYVATLLSAEGASVKVRFLNGADSLANAGEMRMFSLPPGMKVEYLSPSSGIWFTAPVVRYSQEARLVTVNAWGNEENVSIDKVRLPRASGPSRFSSAQVLAYSVASALAGTALGVLIMKLLHR